MKILLLIGTKNREAYTLVTDFKDFEDAIQYHTALENGIDIIITRNKKDFKNSKLPIMAAKEYLNK